MSRSTKAILSAFCLIVVGCNDGPTATITDPELATADQATIGMSSSDVLTDGEWRTKLGLFPTRAAMAAVVFNRSIIVVGGENGNRQAMSRVSAYNLDTKTWSQLQPLPAPRAYVWGVTPLGGKLYVAGGRRLGSPADFPQKSLFVYDPATNTWTRKADMPLPAYAGGVQGAINGILYAYQFPYDPYVSPQGGTFLMYTPATDKWVRLPVPRGHQGSPVGGVIDGKFYLAGGMDAYSNTSTELDMYNPRTGTWTAKRPMLFGQDAAMAAVFHGRLFVAGGVNYGATLAGMADLQVYDPATDTWTRGTSMPSGRWIWAAAAGGGKFWVIGGRQDGWRPTYKVEAYVPWH
jgi:N-acetylneuraminic acid mutarotase